MAQKQTTTIRVLGVAVKDLAGDVDFTSDIMKWADFSGFSLNVWFQVLNGTDPKPTIDIEVSNTTDANSFQPLINKVDTELINLEVPRLWEIKSINAEYIRFKYKSTGVGASSFVTFDFNKLTL